MVGAGDGDNRGGRGDGVGDRGARGVVAVVAGEGPGVARVDADAGVVRAGHVEGALDVDSTQAGAGAGGGGVGRVVEHCGVGRNRAGRGGRGDQEGIGACGQGVVAAGSDRGGAGGGADVDVIGVAGHRHGGVGRDAGAVLDRGAAQDGRARVDVVGAGDGDNRGGRGDQETAGAGAAAMSRVACPVGRDARGAGVGVVRVGERRDGARDHGVVAVVDDRRARRVGRAVVGHACRAADGDVRGAQDGDVLRRGCRVGPEGRCELAGRVCLDGAGAAGQEGQGAGGGHSADVGGQRGECDRPTGRGGRVHGHSGHAYSGARGRHAEGDRGLDVVGDADESTRVRGGRDPRNVFGVVGVVDVAPAPDRAEARAWERLLDRLDDVETSSVVRGADVRDFVGAEGVGGLAGDRCRGAQGGGVGAAVGRVRLAVCAEGPAIAEGGAGVGVRGAHGVAAVGADVVRGRGPGGAEVGVVTAVVRRPGRPAGVPAGRFVVVRHGRVRGAEPLVIGDREVDSCVRDGERGSDCLSGDGGPRTCRGAVFGDREDDRVAAAWGVRAGRKDHIAQIARCGRQVLAAGRSCLQAHSGNRESDGSNRGAHHHGAAHGGHGEIVGAVGVGQADREAGVASGRDGAAELTGGDVGDVAQSRIPGQRAGRRVVEVGRSHSNAHQAHDQTRDHGNRADGALAPKLRRHLPCSSRLSGPRMCRQPNRYADVLPE